MSVDWTKPLELETGDGNIKEVISIEFDGKYVGITTHECVWWCTADGNVVGLPDYNVRNVAEPKPENPLHMPALAI